MCRPAHTMHVTHAYAYTHACMHNAHACARMQACMYMPTQCHAYMCTHICTHTPSARHSRICIPLTCVHSYTMYVTHTGAHPRTQTTHVHARLWPHLPLPGPTAPAHPWGPPRSCYPGPPCPQLLRFVSPRSRCASYETKHNPWFVDASAVLKWKGPQQPGLWGVPVSCLARVLLNAQTGAVCPRSSQKPGWWASRRWWERLWQECALYLWPRGGSGAELHALGLYPSAPTKTGTRRRLPQNRQPEFLIISRCI